MIVDVYRTIPADGTPLETTLAENSLSLWFGALYDFAENNPELFELALNNGNYSEQSFWNDLHTHLDVSPNDRPSATLLDIFGPLGFATPSDRQEKTHWKQLSRSWHKELRYRAEAVEPRQKPNPAVTAQELEQRRRAEAVRRGRRKRR